MADFFDITKRGTVSYRAGEVFGVVDCHNNLMAFSESLCPKKDRYGAVVEHENDINFSPIDHNAAYEKLCSEGERKCDFFLHTDSRRTLVFVEDGTYFLRRHMGVMLWIKDETLDGKSRKLLQYDFFCKNCDKHFLFNNLKMH